MLQQLLDRCVWPFANTAAFLRIPGPVPIHSNLLQNITHTVGLCRRVCILLKLDLRLWWRCRAAAAA